jgi:hypothetical protein
VFMAPLACLQVSLSPGGLLTTTQRWVCEVELVHLIDVILA